MRVLHIGKYFPPYAGGMETYLRDLMATQARQGIDTAALVHQSEIGISSRAEVYMAGDQPLPITRAAVWARFLFTPISPTFGRLLRRLIRQRQPDILHLHMPNVSVFWALLLPGARRIPWVVHWHSDVLASRHSVGLRLFYALYRPFERAVLKRSTAIIASSPPYLESSRPLAKFRGKSHVVPLGLTQPAIVEPPAEPAAGDHSSLQVLAVGRLTYYKGFDYLLRAAARCPGVQIHLVGRGEQEGHLKALARELGVEHRAHFHGHLPDAALERQFATCDCLCLPSIERTEAFGMVLLEAMSRGRATIVSTVQGSGMAWVVDDGITGLHVPPENPDALATALRHMQRDRDKTDQLGAAGRQKFNRLFRIDQSAAGVAAVYSRVLEASRANLRQVNP